jgi:hypothetical protein
MSGERWHRREFLAARDGYRGLCPYVGWTWRVWGIYRTAYDGWVVAHLPSGQRMPGRGYPTLAAAKDFCAAIDPLAKWDTASLGRLGRVQRQRVAKAAEDAGVIW